MPSGTHICGRKTVNREFPWRIRRAIIARWSFMHPFNEELCGSEIIVEARNQFRLLQSTPSDEDQILRCFAGSIYLFKYVRSATFQSFEFQSYSFNATSKGVLIFPMQEISIFLEGQQTLPHSHLQPTWSIVIDLQPHTDWILWFYVL